ncbi:MAG: 4-(cytidine 5'-diphospho)-2-C-methyl-D-erythritol kinase [Opitutaceae bacterium]|nr:4-(cytidine 5'-diphospho)-2-C-methyl-D-erythritol kinase [Opitutaceae bacterium]
MNTLSIFAPAKLNLCLAVTGRRADGFHDLLSVVSQLDFGDTLRVEPAAEFSLTCDDPAVPADETNLVLKAARAFAAAAGWRGGAKFVLTKRIPAGAGLGGGSSDAVAALRGLNQLAGAPLDAVGLAQVAAGLGSDCPLFLEPGPVVMRGRGERIAPLPPEAAGRVRGRRVLVFKPAFGIATPWAYARLAATAPVGYQPAVEAEARLAAWIAEAAAPVENLLFNNMEPPAFAKFLALPALLAELRVRFGLHPRMSGSGSACFALLGAETDAAPITTAVRAAWGASAFVTEARLT